MPDIVKQKKASKKVVPLTRKENPPVGTHAETSATSAANIATTNSNRIRLHKECAERWHANSPWAAEWIDNIVRYCQTTEGQKRFEAWLRSRNAPQGVQDILNLIGKPPATGRVTSTFSVMNDLAARELGVDAELLHYYQQFPSIEELWPERTLPAIKRRKRNGLDDSPQRKHQLSFSESILHGCKIPDVDWHEIRKIAVAQHDALCDTFEQWRTDLDFYLEMLAIRAGTTISIASSLEVASNLPGLEDPKVGQELQRRLDAYQSTLMQMHMGHAFWGKAASVLNELAARGPVTSSAIERAYKHDPHLKWRLASVGHLCTVFIEKVFTRLITVLALLPAFRSYIKQYRTNDGVLHREVSHTYLRAHPFQQGTVDELVVHMCAKFSTGFFGFYETLTQILRAYPKEAEKFDSNAWDEIGILADVGTFMVAFNKSAFGTKLMKYTATPVAPEDEKVMMEEICFIDPARLHRTVRKKDRARAKQLTQDVHHTWLNTVFSKDLQPIPFLYMSIVRDWEGPSHEMFRGMDTTAVIAQPFDVFWFYMDKYLWERAQVLDCPRRRGQLAKLLGLWDPKDPARPVFIRRLLRDAKKEEERALAKAEDVSEKPVNQSSFPIAATAESTGQSGRVYVAANVQSSKGKVKMRRATLVDSGEGSGEDLDEDEDEDVDVDDSEEDLPGVLPGNFRLPKKVWKTFNRLLVEESADGDPSQKKGQIRWGEFEKGMKRLGFDVVQTAGSSIRFDPPARRARPITFHRPHPESLLTPHMIRWIGQRLRRTYGWTTESFERMEGEDGGHDAG